VVRGETVSAFIAGDSGAKSKNGHIVESTSGLDNERGRQLPTDGALHDWPL